VDLDRRFGLNIFEVERVYPVHECDGKNQYTMPKATYENYCHFGSVTKTRLRVLLKRRFGKVNGNRIMNRYLAFDYEFHKHCWAIRYSIQDEESIRYGNWAMDTLLELADTGVAIFERGGKEPKRMRLLDRYFGPNDYLRLKYDQAVDLMQVLGSCVDEAERKKKPSLLNAYLRLSREFPTNWVYASCDAG
jgi:hypothetical protein